MTDLESNIQAYRTMAEVLVNLRKIVVRGLERVAGDAWYREGCPPAVYQRLIDRKESELAIQRFSSEYEDLIGFATFEDLAEIIEFNQDLARLLRNLAPSSELLCARLLELEALRSKLAQGRGLSVEEITVITNYSTHLVATLAGARRRTSPARETASAAAAAAEVGQAPETGGGTGEVEAEELTVREEPAEQPPAAAAEAFDRGPEAPASAAVPAAEGEVGVEPPLSPVEESPEQRTAAKRQESVPIAAARSPAVEDRALPEDRQEPSDESVPPSAAPRSEFDAIAAEMERALAEGDARDVLRVLRREVIAVAEAVYRLDEGVHPPGWQRVHKGGWFSEHTEQFGLEPLAEFHSLVEEYQVGQAEGLDPAELRGMLSSRRFSRLLLTLREMFLRNGV